MRLRAFESSDIDQLYEIWEKQYQDEFTFPNFFKHFVGRFIVVDSNERIISGGGVRTICESVIITDKRVAPLTRRDALIQILEASLFTCGRLEYDELHAFIQDEGWKKVLQKYHFKPCKGEALVIGV